MDLDTRLKDAFRLTTTHKKALSKLKLHTVRDLLYHFPVRYTDISEIRQVRELEDGDSSIVYGRITKLETKKARNKKLAYAEGELEDATGKLKIIWWNQPYLAKTLKIGALVKLSGSTKKRNEKERVTMSNPEVEYATEIPLESDTLFQKKLKNGTEETIYGVYPESRGITSRWMYHKVEEILRTLPSNALADPIPEKILKKYHLPKLATALFWIHRPKQLSLAKSGRKRFAFEEIFFIQLSRQSAKSRYKTLPSFDIAVEKETRTKFTKRLPFELTNAQKKASDHILKDLHSHAPMSRLLEGDVGSGKTAVAALSSHAVVNTRPAGQVFGNLQVAYMAPTEVLARQLFDSFIEYFAPASDGASVPVQIGLLTGSECRKYPSKVDPKTHTHISKAQLLKWVANDEIPILIGTHALIQKSVTFKHLALVIIDEQHRFGVNQRQMLARKDTEAGTIVPHLLSMTATPIPRTLALTLYGDLDLTLLDAMPKGRKKVITEIVPGGKRKEVYRAISKEVQNGRQVYVICPRIDEPDPTKERAIQAKSVKAESKRLSENIFPEYEISYLHSKMTPKAKEETMRAFSEKKIDILVSTSVVEVGVNVPNATVIIIEGAERFGLAQLHQLRGRVLRSTHQAYCYVFTESRSAKTRERLQALKTAKNGFELAELDLSIRGAGELSGAKQWGISDIGMEAIKNLKMVEAARTEAQNVLSTDPTLERHPSLKEGFTRKAIHFE